ncbi:STAS domain-containing protein [Streptodolium elevatio]
MSRPHSPPPRVGIDVTGLPPLEMRTEHDPERAVVHLAGEIDQDNAAHLRSALDRALNRRPSGLHLDAAGVSFCDSAGLHALLRVRDHAQHAGVALTLTPSRQLKRLLQITGTAVLFRTDGAPADTLPPAGAAARPRRTG